MGVLVLLKGQPGSGKSTLGKALASRLKIPLIAKDDARDYLHQGSLSEAHPSIDWNSLSYDIMFSHVETQLSVGLSAIVDSPLARQELFETSSTLAKQYAAEIALIEIFTSDHQEWSRRLSQRGSADAGTKSSHKPGSMKEVHSIMKRNDGSETWSDGVTVPCHVILDSCVESVDGMVENILDELDKAGLIGMCSFPLEKACEPPLVILARQPQTPDEGVLGFINIALWGNKIVNTSSMTSLKMLRHLLQKKLPRALAPDTTHIRLPYSSSAAGTPKIMKAAAEAYSEGPTTLVKQGAFSFVVDEPPKLGGKGIGANPLTHLLGSLMACTSYTATMIINELKLPKFNRAAWSASGEYDLRGLQSVNSDVDARFSKISLKGVVNTDASEEDLDTIRNQIEKRCIVAATLGASAVEMDFKLEKGQVDHDCQPACEFHSFQKGVTGKVNGNPGSEADSPQFAGTAGQGKAKTAASARGYHTQSSVFWAANGEDVAREHLDPNKQEPQVQKEQSEQGAEETRGGAYASRDSPRAQASPPTEGKSDEQLVAEQTAGAKTHPSGHETGKSEEKGGSEPVTSPPGFADKATEAARQDEAPLGTQPSGEE